MKVTITVENSIKTKAETKRRSFTKNNIDSDTLLRKWVQDTIDEILEEYKK